MATRVLRQIGKYDTAILIQRLGLIFGNNEARQANNIKATQNRRHT